jgi:trehalose 6-phosphate phosphatase
MARHKRNPPSTVKSPQAGIRSRRGAAPASRRLFDDWTAVRRRLRAAQRIALFLDFDGTLAPICRRPEEVAIAPPTRRVLKRLARHPRVKVYVISGRRMPDVRRHVRIGGITYLGLHGWERSGEKLKRTKAHRSMQRLRREIQKKLAGLEGIWVQDKFIVFVVHYRRASAAARRQARRLLEAVLQKAASKVRMMEGKKVWEVLPKEVKGKGAAVLDLLRKLPGSPLPVYAGDDTTDEAAFEALPRGITIRVGKPRPTRARYQLRGPGEVRMFLERLEAEIA